MEQVFVKQDGTEFVVNAETIEFAAQGKQLFINGMSVAEYLSEEDACEAAESLKEDYPLLLGKISLPVKHFQAAPFVECAWCKEEIDAFLNAAAKLPTSFLDEFCRVYKECGRDDACKTAKEVTDFACVYDDEIMIQENGEQEP